MANIQERLWPHYSFLVPQTAMKAKVRLVGLGSYTPKGIITNEFFASISTNLGEPRSADDLERVTGLSKRCVRASTLALCRKIAGEESPGLIDDPEANSEESLVDMAVIAAQRALASSGRDVSEIDTIIGASSSDNDVFPTIAGWVQMRLGLFPIRATMLRGSCACQTEAFQICSEILEAHSAKLVLLVIADGMLANTTNILDWKTSSLFAEGAAAFLIERSDEDTTYLINGVDASKSASLIYQTPLRKDAVEMAEIDMKMQQLYRKGRSKELHQMLSQYQVGYMSMNGKEVFREAPRAMAECVDLLCRHANLSPGELAHIVPHQANSRITRRMGELLVRDFGWPASTMDKIVDNFRNYGNLANVSIAAAFVEALRQDRMQDGEWIALPAVGGGLNYGCWLMRYHTFKNPDAILNPTI
jgi:3-oxoacyl-(acyl-carrier-protein) synthase III